MKIFTRKQGKISLSACSSEGWLDISQEILLHLEFSHTTQGINIAFILSQRMNLGHKNQQFFKKSPCGSTWSKNPIVPMQTCTGWEAGEKQFEQSSVSAACAVQLLQHPQQTDPKKLHWFNQSCIFNPWKERAEIPHTQSSIPVSHWKLLVSCPAGTPKLFQLFLLQEGAKNEIL